MGENIGGDAEDEATGALYNIICAREGGRGRGYPRIYIKHRAISTCMRVFDAATSPPPPRKWRHVGCAFPRRVCKFIITSRYHYYYYYYSARRKRCRYRPLLTRVKCHFFFILFERYFFFPFKTDRRTRTENGKYASTRVYTWIGIRKFVQFFANRKKSKTYWNMRLISCAHFNNVQEDRTVRTRV